MAPAVIFIALRVDRDVADVKKFLDEKGCGGFGVREVADQNEHWHFLVETDKFKNLQSFRVNLTKSVPTLKGNASYSATAVDDEGKYERYMCKGNSDGECPEIAWRNSLKYTDEKIGELHAAYWKENMKLKKRKVGSVIDFVVDECKRDDIKWNDREKISVKYVSEISKRAKPFNQFAARSAVNAIQLQLCPDDSAIKMFAELI